MAETLTEHPVTCFCGSPMKLRSSRYGPFYGCTRYPECDGAHGCHPDGKPLGTPADRATKAARIRAHDAFDTLYKSGRMTRKDAYRWLQTAMGMTKEECHIGRFTIAECDRVVSTVNTLIQHAHKEEGTR